MIRANDGIIVPVILYVDLTLVPNSRYVVYHKRGAQGNPSNEKLNDRLKSGDYCDFRYDLNTWLLLRLLTVPVLVRALSFSTPSSCLSWCA